MKTTLAVKLAGFIALALTVTGINYALWPADVAAQAKAEYRVVSIKLPFGERGALQYEALLNDMAAQGWQFDHTITGFTVFKKS